MKARFGLIRVLCPISSALSYKVRLQNSPYFCVFKYAQAVTQKVWNEAENKERDWFVSLASHARFTDFFTDFEKNDCFAIYYKVQIILALESAIIVFILFIHLSLDVNFFHLIFLFNLICIVMLVCRKQFLSYFITLGLFSSFPRLD